ncbi:type I secretion system permease/ATPase [Brucella sp. 10RB9214]|nr:type I secretion system permease/ATPase [Brucella sp. 10RB9212]MRN50847.1 type I secretion system permease/ATPase [Brucella sp. 10RB9214]
MFVVSLIGEFERGVMRGLDLRLLAAGAIIDIGIFSLVINLLLLISPLYMLQVYDRVLVSGSLSTLLYLTIAAVGGLAFLGLIEIIRSIYSQRVAADLDRRLGASAFRASLNGPRAESGDIQPLRDLNVTRSFIASKGLSSLFDLPFAPFFILLLYFVHPVLCMLALGGMALMIVIVIANQSGVAKATAGLVEKSAKANLMAQAFVRNGDTLRSMGISNNVVDVWGTAFAESLVEQDRAVSINSVFGGLSRFVRMLLQMAILGTGAYLVLQNQMTAGMIFASSIISGRALQPLDQLIGGWKQTAEAWKAWKRLQTALKPYSLPVGPKLQLPDPTGAVSVQNLVFVASGAAASAEPILKRISFDIKAGETIALIGPSRAGKSTLARLLVGAALPTSGSISIDGANLRTWNEDQIGQAIGYLAQDVQLLPGTIAENVSRFDPNASDQAIVKAAQRAQAHDLIMRQSAGYQTRIGYSSGMLSGGERQRVGLARAFYGDPKILVLDEPNANLDAEGEVALEKALADARNSAATVIVITHRMSIAATCDRVLVLRDGSIIAYGPPSDVLRGPQVASSQRQSMRPQGGAAQASERHNTVRLTKVDNG